MDVEAHVEEWAARAAAAGAASGSERQLADMAGGVAAAAAELADMETALPAGVCLGLVQVQCSKVGWAPGVGGWINQLSGGCLGLGAPGREGEYGVGRLDGGPLECSKGWCRWVVRQSGRL